MDGPAGESLAAAPQEELARQIVLEQYGLDGAALRLQGYEDENFRIDVDGRSYVLKLVPTSSDADYVDFQVAILRHLAEARAGDRTGIEFPRIILNRSGQFVAAVKYIDGSRRFARLVTWVRGRPMSAVADYPLEVLRELGAAVAAVYRALSDFRHPADARSHPWDIASAEPCIGEAEAIEDGRVRERVRSHIAGFAERHRDLAPSLATSVIHGDPNTDNVLLREDPDGSYRVAGLIDFGDAVRSATVFDLAIACTYAMMNREDPWAAGATVVSGYESVRALAPAETDILYPAILARLAMSLSRSARARFVDPDNAYLQVSDGAAGRLLWRLEGVSEAEARSRLMTE